MIGRKSAAFLRGMDYSGIMSDFSTQEERTEENGTIIVNLGLLHRERLQKNGERGKHGNGRVKNIGGRCI